MSSNLPLRLDSSEWWPKEIKARVLTQCNILKSNQYMENLIEYEPFRSIAEELNDFILERKIIGYHCTKEHKLGYFNKNGLRTLNIKSHQEEFLQKFQSYFSDEEIDLLKKRWDSYFHDLNDVGRSNKIWFCLSPNLVTDWPGTRHFFEYFGGEAIYWPVKDCSSIINKLRNIGNPVVIEAVISPQELRTFSQFTYALVTLSLFHNRQNSEAYIHDREGFLM